MGPPSYMRSVVDRKVAMRRIHTQTRTRTHTQVMRKWQVSVRYTIHGNVVLHMQLLVRHLLSVTLIHV